MKLSSSLEKLNKHHISSIYEEFIELRGDADYNIITIITPEDAQKALNLAGKSAMHCNRKLFFLNPHFKLKA